MSQSERLGEARRGLGLRLMLLLSVVVWVLLFAEIGRGSLNLGVAALLLTAGVAFPVLAVLGSPGAGLLSSVQVLATFAVVIASYRLAGDANVLALLSVPVLLSVFLFPEPVAAVVVVAAGALPVAWVGEGPVVTSLALAGAIVIGGAMALLGAAWWRRMLCAAWGQTDEGVALARQVRLRQEEVNRLNKALRVSNGLLKRSLNELALAQREAQEAKHLKEQFATTVSHELRTPLNIILGFVEVMQRYPEVYTGAVWTPGLRRDVAEIQRSARYLSELIDDILDLARFQALRMPLRREYCDLAMIVSQAVDLASRLLADKREVRLVERVPKALPPLFVDQTRVRQVLLNLLANACRFTDAGEIVITAMVREEEVVVSVADTGPGIPSGELGRIFQEFRQIDDGIGAGKRQAGKGLGLAIARRFVQMHGGQMWVESAVGLGSTFYFSLPLEEKQVVYLPEAAADRGSGSAPLPSVVVVGGPEDRTYMERRLEGYDILGADDVADARRLALQEHSQGLVVVVPPDAEDARQGNAPLLLGEPVPVMQCTLPANRSQADRRLFDDWLVKPVDGDSLARALERSAPSGTLLVVDDDLSFVRLVRRMVEAQAGDRRVIWAHSGPDALAQMQAEPVTTVLLDIALPGMSGRLVAEKIRQEQGDAAPAIIAVTAHQPGGDGRTPLARSFTVTTAVGLTEEDTLALIRACLGQLKPGYPVEEPAAAQPEAEDEKQAS